MKPKHYTLLLCAVLACLFAACSADVTPPEVVPDIQQETSAYTLNVHRNFGYGGGAEIKGYFSMVIVGDLDKVSSVTYLLDGQVMNVETAAPFEFTFETTQYPYGQHTLTARVERTDGTQVETPARTFIFATSEQEQAAVQEILVPLITAVIVAALLGVSIQALMSRRRGRAPVEPGTPRDYGMSGGAVCPRCQRPFALHFLSPHLLLYKLERCENCGKWVMVRRASPEELRAAEQAELREARVEIPHEEQVEEKKEKDQIDDSKYSS